MYLQEVFDQLSDGEFSQISIGGAPAGVIDESNTGKVINHLNLALTSIYKRFYLKESRLEIPLQTGTSTYQLNIVDILNVEQILTDGGTALSLDRSDDPFSCFMTTTNTLRVPEAFVTPGSEIPDALKTENIIVVYRANHPKLTLMQGLMQAETTPIELPASYLMALLYFVASRAHNPIGMVNEFHSGNTWFMKYEGECKRLELESLQVDTPTENTRLERNGWV